MSSNNSDQQHAQNHSGLSSFPTGDTGGALIISGEGEFEMPFRFRPLDVLCEFDEQCDYYHPTCGGGVCPGDECNVEIFFRGQPWRPKWFVRVSWSVGEDRSRRLLWAILY